MNETALAVSMVVDATVWLIQFDATQRSLRSCHPRRIRWITASIKRLDAPMTIRAVR